MCTAVMHRMNDKGAHEIDFAPMFAFPIGNIDSILTFARLAFKNKTVLVLVDGVANCLVIAKSFIVLVYFEVAFSPSGMFVLVPDEVWLVYQVVIHSTFIFIFFYSLFLLFFFSFAFSFLHLHVPISFILLQI